MPLHRELAGRRDSSGARLWTRSCRTHACAAAHTARVTTGSPLHEHDLVLLHGRSRMQVAATLGLPTSMHDAASRCRASADTRYYYCLAMHSMLDIRMHPCRFYFFSLIIRCVTLRLQILILEKGDDVIGNDVCTNVWLDAAMFWRAAGRLGVAGDRDGMHVWLATGGHGHVLAGSRDGWVWPAGAWRGGGGHGLLVVAGGSLVFVAVIY